MPSSRATTLGGSLLLLIALAPLAQGSRVTTRSLNDVGASADARHRAAAKASASNAGEAAAAHKAAGRAKHKHHSAAAVAAHVAAHANRTTGHAAAHSNETARPAVALSAAAAEVNSPASHQGKAASGTAGEREGGEASAETVRRLVGRLIKRRSSESSQEQCWVENGDRMGCKADCQCGMLEQCYPKFVSVVHSSNGDDHEMANIGICGTAMPVLICVSGALFLFLLTCVVAVRMCLQWRESMQAEAANYGHPKVLLTSGPAITRSPSSQADSGRHAVKWPEAETVHR